MPRASRRHKATGGSGAIEALKSESDPAKLLASTTVDSAVVLRRGLASMYTRHCSSAINRAFPLPASRIAVDKSFTPEQVWGQMSVLYAPVLKSVGEAVRRLAKTSGKASGGDAKKAKAKTSGKSKTLTVAALKARALGDEDNASDSGVSSDSAVDALQNRLAAVRTAKAPRRGGGAKRNGGGEEGGDADAWRYALGKPDGDEDEDEELDEAFDAAEEAEPSRRKRNGRGDAAGSGSDDYDGAFGGSDDANEDAFGDDEEDGNADAPASDADDTADDGEDEEEEGEINYGLDSDEMADLEGADDDAAMREMYGSDYEADTEEDEEADENIEDYTRQRDDEEAEEEEEDGDDDGGAAASPFGPDAAPVNPLDFADIEDDPSLTAFQKDERKRVRQIQDIEQQRLLGQHWSMQGEIQASHRPKDALINEPLEFEHALRPAPIITETFTAKLEDRIKKRIVDNLFDDVERRILQTKPEDLEQTKRADEAIEAQKSKLSLMDLYEKQFLEKQAAADAVGGPAMAENLTEIERDELKAVQMWKRLAQHLDALSNFYFTPKPVNPELDARVRATQNQAPAISLESVGMTSLAKGSILAPQDVFRPKRHRLADVASSELVPAERRAIRRAAKDSHKASQGRKEKQQLASGKKKSGKGASKPATPKSE